MPNKPYDLEVRTLEYAKRIIRLCKQVVLNVIESKIVGQLVRAASSVGANYREANEAVSKKDFLHRVKIARKECKESSYWLELLKEVAAGESKEIDSCIKESRELRNILSAIIEKKK